MPIYLNADAPHWYVHLEMDVVDADGAKEYLKNQCKVEEKNGMYSFEFFSDNPDNPSKVLLLECFPSDDVQSAHLENIQLDKWIQHFTNFKLHVYGNPPQSTIDRMRDAGFWPPAFEGEFLHVPYLLGFRK